MLYKIPNILIFLRLFAPMIFFLCATQAIYAASISGTVFEDKNYDGGGGRSLAYSDESTFETVCEVKAAGQSVQTLNYQTKDKNTSAGLPYYRLKQVDMDGTASYSDLVAIEITTVDQISISPNPASDFLNVKIESLEDALTIQIINMTGQIVMQKNLSNGNESYNQQLNISSLKPGLYYVIKSGNASVRGKFVKG